MTAPLWQLLESRRNNQTNCREGTTRDGKENRLRGPRYQHDWGPEDGKYTDYNFKMMRP